MKVSRYKTITETRRKEIGYNHTCNKCGKVVTVDHENPVAEFGDDIKDFSVSFGYESNFDGESWYFSLCEGCLLDLIKTFKHVPDGFQLDDHSGINGREEHQKVFEEWLKTGQWEELKFKTYEELISLHNGWTFTADYLNQFIREYHPNKPLLEELVDEE